MLAELRHAGLVLYSMQPPEELIEDLLDLGCAGFVDKTAPAENLVDAVLAAAHPPSEVRSSRDWPHAGGLVVRTWPGRTHGLSRREAEIMSLIAQGLTNEEISSRTYLSANTIKSYVRSAYTKLGISRRAEAVRWGMEQGLDLVEESSESRRPQSSQFSSRSGASWSCRPVSCASTSSEL